MKLSARNQIKGIDIGNGVVMTSSITNEAVEELGLKAGHDAIVVVKASDVMIAVA